MGFWTPDKVEILKSRWAAGTSARAIAGLLGAGRNAVIGKAYRLDLPTHPASTRHPALPRTEKKPKAKLRASRARRVRASAPPSAPLPPPPPISPPSRAQPEPLRIPFADLERHHCRYAVSARSPHVFCGCPRKTKSPYCAFHHALCREKPREKRQAAARQDPLRAAGFGPAAGRRRAA